MTTFEVNPKYADQFYRGLDFLNLTREERVFFLIGYDIADQAISQEELGLSEDEAMEHIVGSRLERNDPTAEMLSLEPAFRFGMRDAILTKREREVEAQDD